MERAAAVEQIRSLLSKGAPWDASDVFRDALTTHGDDAELLYWGALAHARCGATREARSLLERIGHARSLTPAIRRESLCLSGRLWKDRIDPGATGRDEAIVHARADYLAAYAIDRDSYPGTNAATLSLLLGERDMALELARTLIARLADRTDTPTAWEEATLGEAWLLLGDLDAARSHYTRAHESAPDALGNIASMRRQLALLATVLPEATTLLDAVPQAPVLLFAGHMIDRPGAGRVRFPAALEPYVAEALAAALAHRARPVVYTSAACGGDLLFIEAALAVDAEVNIVLPFDRDDFVEASGRHRGSRMGGPVRSGVGARDTHRLRDRRTLSRRRRAVRARAVPGRRPGGLACRAVADVTHDALSARCRRRIGRGRHARCASTLVATTRTARGDRAGRDASSLRIGACRRAAK